MSNKAYLVHPVSSEAGSMETLPATNGLITIPADELEKSDQFFSDSDKVCITSEACLGLVHSRIKSTNTRNAIDALKDKSEFRNVLKELFPDYKYQKVQFEEIANIELDRKCVLKPLKGCFGTGVRVLSKNSDLHAIAKSIKAEIDKNSSVLSDQVLTTDDFILEQYVDGEEYAVDMFFDNDGVPHIVNIYHHPIPGNEAYLHMIYYTSRQVFNLIYDKAIEFFVALQKVLPMRNVVLHSEFKLTNGNTLFPIEINAMRYGGMGLGNMSYYALDVNPYECFILDKAPEWNKIWGKKSNEDSIYAYFIAYNGNTINKKTSQPDVVKLKNEFTKVLNEYIMDYKTQLAFATFSLLESESNLQNLLAIDFDDYFMAIP